MSMPTVSVVIDTYNHERFIRHAVDSVLQQDGIDLDTVEIIVIDDGSKDSSLDLLKEYGDRIRVHAKANAGQAMAFNDGVAISTAPIIAFLDGDDWWAPRKLARILTTFQSHPNAVAVGHGIVIADEVAGQQIHTKPMAELTLRHGGGAGCDVFHASMSFLGTSRLAVRRSALAPLMPVPTPLIFEADEWLFTLLPAVGPVIVLPECLTYYRLHGNNLFQDSKTEEGARGLADPRIAVRAGVFDCLSRELPPALERLGCKPDVIQSLMEPVHLQARRLKFVTSGGSRWANFRSELDAARLKKVQRTPVEMAVAITALLLAALLPPKTFFRLRSAYAQSWPRRLRDFVAGQKN